MLQKIDVSLIKPKVLIRMINNVDKFSKLKTYMWEITSRMSCYDEFSHKCLFCGQDWQDPHEKKCTWELISNILDEDF